MENLVFTSLTREELKDLMHETALEAAQAAIKAAQTTDIQEEYITRKEAQKILGVCYNTLESRTREGLIKSYRLGRSIRYKRTEIESALTLRNFGG